MDTNKKMEWVLRIAVFGSFLGHGMFALLGKEQWIGWMIKFGENYGGFDMATATQLLFAVGVIDVIVAFAILVKPIRVVILWAVIWGFWTALMRWLPFIGQPIWDFVERWPNWGAPLALLLLIGWPKTLKEWFRYKL